MKTRRTQRQEAARKAWDTRRRQAADLSQVSAARLQAELLQRKIGRMNGELRRVELMLRTMEQKQLRRQVELVRLLEKGMVTE